MKNLKSYQDYNNTNENVLGAVTLFIGFLFFYKFLTGLFKKMIIEKRINKESQKVMNNLITNLKILYNSQDIKIATNDYDDRYFIRFISSKINSEALPDLRLLKNEKILMIGNAKLPLTDSEYNKIVEIITKEGNVEFSQDEVQTIRKYPNYKLKPNTELYNRLHHMHH